jgi:hypothetical protein
MLKTIFVLFSLTLSLSSSAQVSVEISQRFYRGTGPLEGKINGLDNYTLKNSVIKAYVKTDIWYVYPLGKEHCNRYLEGFNHASLDRDGYFSFSSMPHLVHIPCELTLLVVPKDQEMPDHLSHIYPGAYQHRFNLQWPNFYGSSYRCGNQ